MGQEEKIGLVNGIGQRDIKLGSRDVAGPWEVNLPQCLFGKPAFCRIFRNSETLAAVASCLMAAILFQYPLGL